MLDILYATVKVSILGFNLAILYYLHFSQPQPMSNANKMTSIINAWLSSKTVKVLVVTVVEIVTKLSLEARTV